jgi:hypothetical protein
MRPTDKPTNESHIHKKKRGTKSKRKDGHDDDEGGVDESMYSDIDSLVAPSDSSYDSDLGCIL